MNSNDSQPDWRSLNRANWDERVPIHLGPRGYDVASLLNGRAQLNAIEESELSPVVGLRVLHLQCHFGLDTLVLVQRGATAVGLDFSAPAINAARDLADRLGVADRVRFVQADLYDAIAAIPDPSSFDVVFVTWGALPWLPDIAGWARIVAHFLKPGGWVYLAEGHPAALVLNDEQYGVSEGIPGFFAPYFHDEPLLLDDATDYMDRDARLTHSATCQWIHPVGEVVTSLIDAGLRLDWLHEHPAVAWQMFACLVQDHVGLYRWPDKPWLPLAYSLRATKPQA
jgi:SAM-dependent methyltransferase